MDLTCIDTEFTFSGAHRVRFSQVYGSLHGHNWVVRVRVCVSGRRPLVLDIDRFRAELRPFIEGLDGKYLKSKEEAPGGLAPGEFVELECMEEGLTSECLAWHILDRATGALSALGVSGVEEILVRVCDSPINCFEAVHR